MTTRSAPCRSWAQLQDLDTALLVGPELGHLLAVPSTSSTPPARRLAAPPLRFALDVARLQASSNASLPGALCHKPSGRGPAGKAQAHQAKRPCSGSHLQCLAADTYLLCCCQRSACVGWIVQDWQSYFKAKGHFSRATPTTCGTAQCSRA